MTPWLLLPALALATGLASTAFAAGTSSGTPVSGAEMKSAFSGNTLSGTAPDGSAFHMFVLPDGNRRMKITSSDGKSTSTRAGTYTIEGDLWCGTWGGSNKACQKITKSGSTFMSLNPDGTVNASYTVRPGNPEKL